MRGNQFRPLPPEERKKILLLTDDFRFNSGVANVARDLIERTCQHFKWLQIAAGVNHPEKGKALDLSQAVAQQTGVQDADVKIFPYDSYGDAGILRYLLEVEKPDAILLITDPRYFTWLFEIEHEIRQKVPIVYLNIWDSIPYPMYNKAYYEACDALFAISKQTLNVNFQVLRRKPGEPLGKLLRYLPHGVDQDIFTPLPESDPKLQTFKRHIFQEKNYDFVTLFNSRNMQRKQIVTTILAYRHFVERLTKDQAARSVLVLKTAPVDDNGTDLYAVLDQFKIPGMNVVFVPGELSKEDMNNLYNLADITMLLSSNEGWGLSLTESLMAGTPIIANVTGGMQDQMRFSDEFGNWISFSKDFPSNHYGTFEKCGRWAFPVFPSNITIQGSPITPYIYDERCDWKDAGETLYRAYSEGKENLESRGMAGRTWVSGPEAGFTSEMQGKRFITAMNSVFTHWKPKVPCSLQLVEMEEENLQPSNLEVYTPRKDPHQLEVLQAFNNLENLLD